MLKRTYELPKSDLSVPICTFCLEAGPNLRAIRFPDVECRVCVPGTVKPHALKDHAPKAKFSCCERCATFEATYERQILIELWIRDEMVVAALKGIHS